MEIIEVINDNMNLIQGKSKKNGNTYNAIQVKIGDDYSKLLFLDKFQLMYVKDALGLDK